MISIANKQLDHISLHIWYMEPEPLLSGFRFKMEHMSRTHLMMMQLSKGASFYYIELWAKKNNDCLLLIALESVTYWEIRNTET